MEFNSGFEPVIGLEVHGQLSTSAKIFCRCSTKFDSAINSNLCPVCAGYPGALPVLNRRAVEFAIRAGLATGCRINLKSVFARKNYFYADLPKGYQISQFDLPICEDGYLDIEYGGSSQKPETASRKRVRIQRIHMEEDAGKSVHMAGYSLVNLNRSSVPLIEIVSHPDICSSDEAGAYLRKLRGVLMYIGVNDGNLQEGSFRCDANVSVRPIGQKELGTRAEIKNVNSFRFVEKAIDYEIKRQIEVIKSDGRVIQETRSFDSGKGITYSLRSKEEAHDYRYFPEPDLLPLQLTTAWVEEVKRGLPELPDQKRDRYIKELGIPAYDAAVIVSSQSLAYFFEEVVAGLGKAGYPGEAKLVSNWVMGELLRLMKTSVADPSSASGHSSDPDDSSESGDSGNEKKIPFKAQDLAALIKMIKSGVISNSIAKTVFEEMFRTGAEPEGIVKEKGLGQVSDTGAIEAAADRVIAANPEQLAQFKAGKDKLLGFFVGLVMKQMAGKGNPQIVNEVVKKKLAGA